MSQKTRILIVEDDPLIGLDISQALQGFGYDVKGPVVSGPEAISAAQSFRPNLVMMDINLKGEMDGIEAAQSIHNSMKVPVVFLTADTDETTLSRAKLTQPYGYLIKPFDPVELRSTIELSLHRFSSTEGELEPVSDIAGMESIESEEKDDKAGLLRKIKLLADLPPAAMKVLADGSSIKQLEAGEVILAEGEDCTGGFIPLSGRISVTRTSQAGKDLIVALLAPGDVFGLFYLLESFCGSSWARTQIPSRILWINKSAFQQVCKTVPTIYAGLAEALAARLVHSHELATGLAHARVEGRIVTMLITLLHEFGRTTGKPNEGRIFITRRELADLTGTTSETAIRVTKSLEREGFLDLTRPGIIKILNVDSLRGYSKE